MALDVSLQSLVDRADLGLQVLTGHGELDRPVRWAHVSELRDPVPYLLGGELLLTLGMDFPATEDEIDSYVRGLVDAGVNALGFGVTPVYDAVPTALIDACARHRLPLLAVPPGTPFLAISQAVGVALAEAQNAELRRLSEAQSALTKAAVRSDPTQAVLRVLAEVANCWAVFVTAQAGPGTVDPEVFALAARVRGGTGPRSASTEIGHVHAVAYPVEPGGALVVGGSFSVTDRAINAVALALLGLVGRQEGRLATSMLIDNARCRVVRGWSTSRSPGDVDLGTPLVDITANELRAVVAEDAVPDLESAHANGWLLAVSAPHAAGDLKQADHEAALLLDRVRASGRPLCADQADRDLASLVGAEAGRRFAAAMLRPLPENLLQTLRIWLAHNGNWDRSAAVLGVHRNSVRHRIKQVERALDVDLSDVQHRMELWFALSWLTV